MDTYTPPIDDISFALRHVADLDAIAKLDAFAGLDLDGIDDVLREAARFVSEVVAPTNREGDRHGCRRNDDGTVTTPPGFADAYRRYAAAGWAAAPFDPEYGGGGLPWLVAVAIQEMLTAANMALSLCPMLTHGAIHLLGSHGDPQQKSRWLPKLISGEWTGTMVLTEPQAGSDVGAVSTRAVRQPDGTYRVTGQKIFITWGEHDMAGNIVHLMLARTPDAPPGTRGISCFLVPKFLLDEQGAPSIRNRVECVSIEHKMGIHGSPTCVLAFDDAVGEIIGDEDAGMRYMFTMMNNARLSVGLEGLGIADRAYQQALDFARTRRQGRAVGAPATEQSLIVEHPDVRRMLLTMRAYTEAARALCYVTAEAIDHARCGATAAERSNAQDRADLLTPIAKGWSTDIGSAVASLNVQVHGGMGYIEETGAAQHYRDVRIARIYEGTNGIQAIDLVTRKLPRRGGAAFDDLLAEMTAVVHALQGAGLDDLAVPLAAAAAELRTTGAWLLDAHRSPDDVLAGATPFLEVAGLTVGGWLLGRAALAARAHVDPDRAATKLATARFFLEQLLPRVHGLAPAVTAGAAALDGVR